MKRALSALGIFCLSTNVMASGFQLWEQDVGSVANYHAGYAVLANDASIAFYNPAGITRFKNQQFVLGTVGIMSDFKYKGTVTVANMFPQPLPPTISTIFPNVTAQGGNFAIVPNFHYVTPITDRIGFGFSVDAPFGLKTDYGHSTPLQFAATLTSITVVDISPSIGFKVTDKGSLGLGLDIQRVFAEFDNTGLSVLTSGSNTQATNKADDTAYGYHLGALYEFSQNTRAGISYHSQVVHHLSGHSRFEGPIANALNGGTLESGRATANLTLPPYTALSVYHKLIPQVALMGSIVYTQWNTFKTLQLNNIAGAVTAPFPFITAKSTSITVVVPENYRNTWNISVGADYYVTDQITLRGGIGYDQTPEQNAYRSVQLPDNNRYVIAFGGHYQATKALGMDLGWTHLFFGQARINPPPQVTGGQIVTTNGHVNGGADVFGGQVTWDIC